MKYLVSGIQTSGDLHIGNYLGSICNWVRIYDKYTSFLFLADLHAITVTYDKNKLQQATYEVAAAYLASGIDPNKATIFLQSSVPAHAELAWLLNCITSMGLMNRMTQFKDKAGKDKEKASLGLYAYPVLMAADILIYNANIVPVGEDQKQHLELTRNIAENFNRLTNTNFFNIPEPLIQGQTTRVMSLKNGLEKMSKSNISDYSRINLLDDKDLIAKKIKKAKTDSYEEIYYDKINRPEISNMLAIYSNLANIDINSTKEIFAGKNTVFLKNLLTDLVIEKISPISIKMKDLLEDKQYLNKILKNGSEKANQMANSNLKKIKEIMGFIKI